MSRTLKIHIVERAYALITDEEHSCRRNLANDVNGVPIHATSDRAVKWCGLGAVIAEAYQLTDDYEAAHRLGAKPCVRATAPPQSFMSTTPGAMLRCSRCSTKLSQRGRRLGCAWTLRDSDRGLCPALAHLTIS